MLKKLFVVMCLVMLVGAGTAIADLGGEGNNTQCNGVGNPNSPCGENGNDGGFNGAFGAYDISARFFGMGGDVDVKFIPNGVAFGAAGAIGGAKADADGFVFNGLVKGEVTTIGGGLAGTDAYKWNPHIGDKSIGVGSASETYAITGASAKIKVDPSGFFALGETDARIGGFVAQGSINGSALIESPIYFDHDGFTGGLAAQGSLGAFGGEAFAGSLGDTPDIRFGRFTIPGMNSKAGAGMGAEIEMYGGSYSDSYRFVDWDGDAKTEGMGTFVGAYTVVNTHGYSYDWDKGLSYADADINGGWIAAGGVASKTQIAGAKSTAVGFYVGSGSLNQNYQGSAIGYTNGSVTTVKGMNGSINQAGAGMSVNSIVSHNQLD
jgi:hypothetical protein